MKAKNKIKMFAIIALVALVAVGSTLAYLSSVTDTKENKFTSSKDLTGEITETEWFPNGEQWENYLPGDSHGKNPVIKIENDGVNAYVAMKVVCKDAENNLIDFDEFQNKYATVSYKGLSGINATDWVEDTANSGFYFYKIPVLSGGETNALFDTVTINTGIKTVYDNRTTQETIKIYTINPDGTKTLKETKTGEMIVLEENEKIYQVTADGEKEVTKDAKLPSFQIDVTGYAVQADDKTAAGDAYKDLLRDLAGL